MFRSASDGVLVPSRSPKPVQTDSKMYDLICSSGVEMDPEVAGHILALLRNGVRPTNLFSMLQALASNDAKGELKLSACKEEKASSQQSTPKFEPKIASPETADGSRTRVKPTKAWALSDKPVFSKNSPKG